MGRRSHNEGTVYKRDGRWCGQISLEGGKRKTFYGKTRAEVVRLLASARRAVEDGLPLGDDRQTLAVFLPRWLATVAPSVRPDTLKRHREYVELHILPELGHVRLNRLTPQHVQALYSAKLAGGLSSTTVHHLHTTLHKALDQAVRLDLARRNVSDLVDVPRTRDIEICPLTREQAAALLVGTAADDDRFHALYALALDSGMRQGELLALRWRNVDLNAGVARVEATLKWDGAEHAWLFAPPKTRRSRRQIALSSATVETLRRHRARQAEGRLALGPAWGGGEDHDLVFCTGRGTPLSARNVYRAFLAALERHGLPRIRFHDLRHTCATLLFVGRVNPKVVSERLGHASISITLDVYSHVIPDMQQDAAETIGSLLYAPEEATATDVASELPNAAGKTRDNDHNDHNDDADRSVIDLGA